jgi:hypothetical protein
MKSVAILLLGFLVQLPPIGKADSEFDKTANFATLDTYSWVTGNDALVPEAHKLIVAAVDTEMARLGFKQVATGADVTIAYYTLTIANVDLKALDKAQRENKPASAATKELGKLIVRMRDPAGHQLWSAGTREFLDPDRAKIAATIQGVTDRLFATYPTRARQ